MFRKIAAAVAGAVVGLVLVAAWQLGFLTPEPEAVNLASSVAAETGEEAAGDEASDDSDEGSSDRGNADDASDADASDDDASDDADEQGQLTSTEDPDPDPESEASADDADADETTSSNEPSPATCTFVRPEPADEDAGEAVVDGDSLDGSWVVVASESTFAGYRIDEILSGQDFTAVGRTAGVSGSVLVEGSGSTATITGAEIAVDMVGLSSDSRVRDNQMKSQALQTSRFPTGCFTLSEPIELDPLPAEGDSFLTDDVVGSLHLHGVDRSVSIELQATSIEGLVFVIGSTEITLADFDIEKPTAPSVADVSDTAIMEFSLVLARQP